MFLLDDILLAPVKGVKWVAEQLRDAAERELYDPDNVHEALMSLQAKLDMGEITEEEYAAREQELLQRLTEIREREEQE